MDRITALKRIDNLIAEAIHENIEWQRIKHKTKNIVTRSIYQDKINRNKITIDSLRRQKFNI